MSTTTSLATEVVAYKYLNTFCSQCGEEFGPGDHGYSRCIDHNINKAKTEIDRLRAIVSFLSTRVSYLEHSDANGIPSVKVKIGCYWPQESSNDPCNNTDEDLADLPLIEYIEALLAKESRK